MIGLSLLSFLSQAPWLLFMKKEISSLFHQNSRNSNMFLRHVSTLEALKNEKAVDVELSLRDEPTISSVGCLRIQSSVEGEPT